MTEHLRNYIGGRWLDACSQTFRERRDPATAELLAQFADSDEDDVEEAVLAAQTALPQWRAMPPPARGAILAAVARRIEAEIEPLAKILTSEQGKTIGEAKAELSRAAEAFDFCAGETRRLSGETLPSERPGRLVMTMREPIGVVGLVTPGNYPAQIAAWKIAPALAVGNAVVHKPSELTPWISVKLFEFLAAALEEAKAPAGAVNLVTGGAIAAAALAAHASVGALSFTGSVEGGRALQEIASKRTLPCLLEMGGKNPLVVLDDADLDLAAGAAIRGAFGNAGQRCTATSRAIVLPAIAERFLDEVTQRAKRLRVGPGLDPVSEMGPLVSGEARVKVEDACARATAGGARIVVGGKRGRREEGWFFEPTIIADVKPDSPVAQEEVFGPVLVVQEAKDEWQALELANGVRYGLSASVFTKSLDRAMSFVRGFETGIVHVNSPTVGGETHVPFAGWKATGNGPRERGGAAIDFYTRWKTVYVDSPS